VVIKVTADAVRSSMPRAARGRAARPTAIAESFPESVVEPLDFLRRSTGLQSLEPLFPQSRAMRQARGRAGAADDVRLALAASVDVEDEELAGLAVATVAEDEIDVDVLRTIESSPAIQFVESLPVRWASATATAARPAADPMRNVQWGLRAIRWFEAPHRNQPQISIGVMDTGIDRKHPDLAAVDIDYRHTGLRATDLIGHGTHVAGIVAATADNDIGISGVAQCRLVVWKIFGDEPAPDGEFYVDSERYYAALREAGDAGLSSLNLSIGGFDRFRTEEILLARLIRRGVTVCAAMGNEFEEGDPTEYPAAFENVVSVGAIAEDRRRSSFSNTGDHIDLVAPGSRILSTVPRTRSPFRDETNYVSWNGTSMATPHVAAAAGLVAGVHPQWGPAEVSEQLRDTAAKLPAMRGRDFTRQYGAGLLDLTAALS
jgi:subtilisin family serine protease